MAALDFPASPQAGDKYPTPAVVGQPQYTFDGTKWTTVGAQITTAAPATAVPLMDQTAGLVGTATKYAREDHVHPKFYAAPFDAMAYSGMQVNGSMEVSQEIGTNIRNFPAGQNQGYVCDGWSIYKAGPVVLNSQLYTLGIIPGFSNILTVVASVPKPTIAAGDYVSVAQYVEGYRFSRMAWGTPNAQPITVSFWSKHNRVGTYSLTIRNSLANRSYGVAYTQNVSDAAEYKTVTIPGCTDGTWQADSTGAMIITFSMAAEPALIAPSANAWVVGNYTAVPGQINGIAATSDVFRLTGVVVLPGVEAPSAARSPFIMRPYDQELMTCMRYYQQIGGVGGADVVALGQAYSSVSMQATGFLPFAMRSAPTVTLVGLFGVAGNDTTPRSLSSYTAVSSTPLSFTLNCTSVGPLTIGDASKLHTTDINARCKIDARF